MKTEAAKVNMLAVTDRMSKSIDYGDTSDNNHTHRSAGKGLMSFKNFYKL